MYVFFGEDICLANTKDITPNESTTSLFKGLLVGCDVARVRPSAVFGQWFAEFGDERSAVSRTMCDVKAHKSGHARF